MYCYNVTEYNIIYNTPHDENFALAEGRREETKKYKNLSLYLGNIVTL